MAKRTKAVAGTSAVSVMDAVERATKQVNEEVSRIRAELDKVRLSTSQVEPLVRDALEALKYCAKGPDFMPNGKHHEGFTATVLPIAKRLEAWLNPLVPEPKPEPVPELPPAQPAP